MKTNLLRAVLASLALMAMVWLTACSKSSNSDSNLSFISISPTATALFPGRTQQLTVQAHYKDGTVSVVSSGASFTASAASVATVNSSGLVTAVGAGTGTVSALMEGKSADAIINVAPPTFAVFTDNYGAGVSFVAFGGSTNALSVDTTEHHTGASSLKIAVPASGYTGGALNASSPQNLSLYNALTFWAKASKAATLNVSGIGNDGLGGPSFSAESANVPLTTSWVKHVIPVPVPAKLTSDIGLFHFAEGADEGAYSIWLDDVQYENLSSADLGAPTTATVGWAPVNVEIGKSQALNVPGTVTYAVPALPDGGKLTNVSLRYFSLTSSAPAVATVGSDGLITGVSLGTASITAKLGSLTVPGAGTVTVITPVVPTAAPPRPTVAPDKVISLLSKAYTNVKVDTWGTSWSNDGAGPNLTELVIGGDDIKKYALLKYVGVEFFASGNAIDASGMTFLHLDIWTPDITDFHVKLVDFGADAGYGGGDDSESEVAVNASTTPKLTGQKQWVSLDLPLANFSSLKSRKHLAQLLFVSATPYGAGTVYIDNVYFHNSTYVDTTPPTVAITDNVPGSATGDVTFTFTFSEDVGTSFTADKVAVTGGSKGTFSKTSNTVYTLVVAPPANATGTIAVTVAAGAFSDLANNASTAPATASQDYDTRPSALTQMDLPVTFDLSGVAYGLAGFGGAENSTIVVDPAGGTNKVAKVVKSATAELWAGTTLTADGVLGFAHKIPFDAANTKLTVRVYSPDAGIKVRLKVEDHANGSVSVETEATTTKVNTWETLTFDFSSQAAGTAALDLAKTYDKASIFFNFGVTGATAGAKTYHFDDVAFLAGTASEFSTVTFDSSSITYALTGFGGAEDSSVVVDPTGGTNKVAKVVKTAAAQTWAGTTVSTGANLSVGKIPFTATRTKMTLRFYSPDAGIKVRLKVENAANGSVSVETEAATTKVNTWETLTFDFASQAAGTAALNIANTYDKASIFPNFGVDGATAGTKTYYFDDLAFPASTAASFSTITFDSSTTTYTLTGFGGAEDSSVVADPTGGTNKVAKVVKSATAESWAGTTVSTGANLSVGKIPFDLANTRMTVKVYSPDAGIKVRLKVENAANGSISVETEAATTKVNTWEVLTFDFASQAAGTAALNVDNTYDKASIFFNFGVTGGAAGGAKTYYFDDLTFIGGTSGSTFATITFDSSSTTYTLTGFGGAEDSSVVLDPAGGTNKVAKVVKSATAELWAGTTVSTGANLSIPSIPFSASRTRMTVRVYSPNAGIKVRLKVENAANGTLSVETEATTTQVNAWETLTFDFAAQASGTAALNLTNTYDKASIFFNFGVTGAAAGGAKTYYFDDLAFLP